MFENKDFWLGIASVVINAAGYAPYIKGILQGQVKPQRITWGIWSILTSVAFINQVINGGGYSAYFFGSTVLLVVSVFILSFKNGMGGRSAFDVTVLIAAIVLFVLWGVTRNTHFTTFIAITIDGIAALPTVYKTYKRPETEAYAQWILAAVSGLLSISAIGKRSELILIAYPLYVVLMNSVIVGTKFINTNNSTRNKSGKPAL